MYLEDLELSTVKVGFPNSVYLVVYHADTDQASSFGSAVSLSDEDKNKFSFDFYYEKGELGAGTDGFEIEVRDIIGKSFHFHPSIYL